VRILFVASEAAPFIKSGGLADVVGALPRTLREKGHDVRVVLPRYSDIEGSKFRLLPLLPELKVDYGGDLLVGSVLRCSFPKSDMPVYFIDEPSLFHRPGLYGAGKTDYPDNERRFAFFNIATLWMLKGLDWQPDVIHLNDWQTGLIPVLLKHHPVIARDEFYRGIRTVFSIHNLAYQGNVDKFLLPRLQLPWNLFTTDGMEFYDRASFLKSGLVFADKLVAVSPTYAEEITHEANGAGMDGALRSRGVDLVGILNGIDTDEWNPANDPYTAARFDSENMEGKAACKSSLQREFGLPEEPRVPLIGLTSRLVAGKGFDLVAKATGLLAAMNAQFVFLGTGDIEFENALRGAANIHGRSIGVRIGYDVPLSHRIIAGSDMFLMPSAYEPCGLTQMYSLRFGTIPIVRKTGGLTDSIFPADRKSIEAGHGTGFMFEEYTVEAMIAGVESALALYANSPATWKRLMSNAMAQDFSWARSAEEYEELYRAAVKGDGEITA